MIILDIDQGIPEWFAARSAIPTSSCFGKILTPTGTASTQKKAYMNKLLSEWLTGKVDDGFKNDWMNRGHKLEDDARTLYQFVKEADPQQTGIVYKDDRKLIACSPDALLPEKGLEIKCPAASTHVGYLLGNKLPTTYIPQVQGSMYVTGFDSWDFMSYHPDMQPLIITVNRDEQYITKLAGALSKFIDEMLKKREQLGESNARTNAA